MKTLSLLVLAFLLLATIGCSKWKTETADTPWIAPNLQAVEQSKRHRHYVQSTWEVRWLGAQENVYVPDRVAEEAERFLVSTLRSNSPLVLQPASRSWKTIVSLSPTIVLLSPSDSGKAKKVAQLGTNFSVRESGQFGNAITRGYYCGTSVFYSESLYWFSPDLNAEPKLVVFTNGAAEIKFPNGELELVAGGDVCKVTRK